MSESGLRFIEPPAPDDRLLAVELDGRFSADDMRTYMERIEKIVGQGKKVRIYQDMRDYEGADAGAITEKFKHMGTLWQGIDRIAIVGDSRWLEIYIGIMDVLTPQQLRHFSLDEKAAAFDWLLE